MNAERIWRIFSVFLVWVIVLGLVAALVFYRYITREPKGEPGTEPTIVMIERGWSLETIAKHLQDEGIIADWRGFVTMARIKGVGEKVQAGEYEIPPGMPLEDVLAMMTAGHTRYRQFMVLPGWTARQVTAELQKQEIDPEGVSRRLVLDAKFAATLGLPAERLEGFLYPETYTYERGENVRRLLSRIVMQGNRIWDQRLSVRAAEMKMTRLQAVTLASIIEREAGTIPEQPKISRVFHNRLAKGMPLQADPTVIYALGDQFDGNLKTEHLEVDNPYNTYKYPGLPPGPIANPSFSALQAALWPAEGAWMYFVADGQGKHVFSLTYEEHLAAVKKYQLKQ